MAKPGTSRSVVRPARRRLCGAHFFADDLLHRLQHSVLVQIGDEGIVDQSLIVAAAGLIGESAEGLDEMTRKTSGSRCV